MIPGQFGLQVIDEGRFERLRLVQHVVLVDATRHGQQQAEVTLFVCITQNKFAFASKLQHTFVIN